MNIVELKVKVENVLNELQAAVAEADAIDEKRIALENSQIVNTQREERLNGIAKTQAKEREDLNAQKTYIEEQNKNTQLVLNKITLEKEALKGLADQKRVIEQERLQLEADKKGLEGLKQEKETLLIERNRFEQEKKLFGEEKYAIAEQTKLIALKEQNIKIKEERLDRIERMTSV